MTLGRGGLFDASYPVAGPIPRRDEAQMLAARVGEALKIGDALYTQGQYAQALQHHLAVLQALPGVAEHQWRVGMGRWHTGNRESARAHLERAVCLDPRYAPAHEALSQLYIEMSHGADALRHARQAAEIAPDNPEIALSLAFVLDSNGLADEAWEIVRRLRETGEESPRLAVLFSRLAPRFGASSDALRLIESLLQGGRFSLQAEEATLHFLLAGLLDKQGRFDEAFAHARQANALRQVPYRPGNIERFVNEAIAFFTPRKLRGLPRSDLDGRKAVFVVGMPRSGSTLIEQILGSHPRVHGAGELTWMAHLVDQVGRRAGNSADFPRCLDSISLRDVDDLAASYLNPLLALNPSADVIVDKFLANVLHLGLISLLFPQARVIHCRRHPLDTCLSCFMTDFAVGNDFSFSLTACGHYYRQYERLIAHWRNVLDLPILDVTYEEVVKDLEGQSRGLLNFLGLPWDDRCLRFHETKRFVATASTEQVRRPIYTSSVGRWRNYERHLAPLRAAIGWG